MIDALERWSAHRQPALRRPLRDVIIERAAEIDGRKALERLLPGELPPGEFVIWRDAALLDLARALQTALPDVKERGIARLIASIKGRLPDVAPFTGLDPLMRRELATHVQMICAWAPNERWPSESTIRRIMAGQLPWFKNAVELNHSPPAGCQGNGRIRRCCKC